MYFYKNGKKVKHLNENFKPIVRENFKGSDSGKKCPTWIFIVLGIIAVVVAMWLVYCIVNDKKSKNTHHNF